MSQPPDERSSAHSSPDHPEDWEAAPNIDLDHVLTRRPSSRRRALQVTLLVATVTAVIFTLWSAVPKGAPGSPEPQPTPLPSALGIVSNVNYGSLTINGVSQPEPLPVTVRLHGKSPYVITLKAPPFRPLSCPFPPPKPGTPWGGIIGSIDSFSPCLAGTVFTMQQQNVTSIEMLLTMADLPTDQQQQITGLIPTAVTAQQTITVPAGSLFVSGLTSAGPITTARAPEPLTATAFLVPSRQSSRPGTSCVQYICANEAGFTIGGSMRGDYWEVTAPVSLRWVIRKATGQLVSDVTFPFVSTLTLNLSYNGPTGWQVGLLSQPQLSQDLSQLVCPTGTNELASLARQASDQLFWSVTTLHDRGLDGCELSLYANYGGNPGDQGLFVWRFGTLMAADTNAHLTLPQLPMAAPADRAAVGA